MAEKKLAPEAATQEGLTWRERVRWAAAKNVGPLRGINWFSAKPLTSERQPITHKFERYTGPEIRTVDDYQNITISDKPVIISQGPSRQQIAIVFNENAPNKAKFKNKNGEIVEARYFTFFCLARPDGSVIAQGGHIIPIIKDKTVVSQNRRDAWKSGYRVLMTIETRSSYIISPPSAHTDNALRKRHITFNADGSRTISFGSGRGVRPPITLRADQCIAFPGGAIDPKDSSLTSGVMRELMEESGLEGGATHTARAIRSNNPVRVMASDMELTNETYIVEMPEGGTYPSETYDEGGTLHLTQLTPDEIEFLIRIGEMDSAHMSHIPWDFLKSTSQLTSRGRSGEAYTAGYVKLKT